MRKTLLSALVASGLLSGAALAIPSHVCDGPAGAQNPHCNGGITPRPERAIPEPGAAAIFALGAGLIALRTRRPR